MGQADPEGVPPANRALDHAQSQGFFAKAALTGLCSAWQSRKRGRRFFKAGAGASKGGRRIDNPPDPGGTPKNLPHNSSRRAEKITDSGTIHAWRPVFQKVCGIEHKGVPRDTIIASL